MTTNNEFVDLVESILDASEKRVTGKVLNASDLDLLAEGLSNLMILAETARVIVIDALEQPGLPTHGDELAEAVYQFGMFFESCITDGSAVPKDSLQ